MLRRFDYGKVPEEIEARLASWIERGRVEEGQVLKPGRAYRYGPWTIKFGGSGGARDTWRASTSRRSARAHFRLLPVRTPRPLVVLERRSGLRRLERSLLVCEFIEGAHLSEVWCRDAGAMRAFPAFLALLHSRPVLHGDFHPRNLLWNGTEWVLIDLDAVRHRLHSLRRKELVLDQWARILRGLDFDESVRAAFAEYLEASGRRWPREPAWRTIETRARAMHPLPDEHRWVHPRLRPAP